jgi:hypothetical protein
MPRRRPIGGAIPLDQVVLQWDARTRVTLTVHVARDGAPPQGAEHRLAEQIAACIWLSYHDAQLTAPTERE